MPLGLSRDSFHELNGLEELSKDDSNLDLTPPENEGQTTNVFIKGTPPEPLIGSMPSSTELESTLAGIDNCVVYSSGDNKIYESSLRVLFKKDDNKKKNKILFCLFPWSKRNTGDDNDEDYNESLDALAELRVLEPASPKDRLFSKPDGGSLRRGSVEVPVSEGLSTARRRIFHPTTYRGRKDFGMFRVQFNPIARVVNIKNRYSMPYAERLGVWWQRVDFNIIKRDNECLATALDRIGQRISISSSKMCDIGYNREWWHKYGHSRRGLEKLASSKEAAQTLLKCKLARQAVFNEQRKQKRKKVKDPERLGRIAREHSMWARDLALAVGAADADAVRSDFDKKRKKREFYLIKQAMSGQGAVCTKNAPAFMMPLGLPPTRGGTRGELQGRAEDRYKAPPLENQTQYGELFGDC